MGIIVFALLLFQMADYPTFRRNELRISDEEFERLDPELKIKAYDQYSASRTGTNCVVFIMWFISGEFYFIVELTFILFFFGATFVFAYYVYVCMFAILCVLALYLQLVS